VKFLIDENLSDKLVVRLQKDYPGTQHVKQLDLSEEPDATNWERAKKGAFILLTQDDDFVELCTLNGAPPKVIHLALGNRTTREWMEILDTNKEQIRIFVSDKEATLLVITNRGPVGG